VRWRASAPPTAPQYCSTSASARPMHAEPNRSSRSTALLISASLGALTRR
jgi:hypothetical protein